MKRPFLKNILGLRNIYILSILVFNMAKDVEPRSISYPIDTGQHSFFGDVQATIYWDFEDKKWYESRVTTFIEPEWGQADAGRKSVTDPEIRPLDPYAVKELLKLYNVDSSLVESNKVHLMLPSELEQLADTAK